MLNRFRRVQSEFGTGATVRMAVLLAGVVGVGVLGAAGFGTWWPAAAGTVGLALGALLRRRISAGVKYYDHAINAGLVAYAVVLGFGGRLGLDAEARLVVIAVATVVVFDLQFWPLSDPEMVNAERRSGP